MKHVQAGAVTQGCVTDIAFGGEGVIKKDGAVIFVPYAALGDELTIEITEAKASFYRARMLQIKQASPDRAAPPCPYYGACGGCQYQHVSYEAERRYKEAQLVQILRRIGRIEAPLPLMRPMLFSEPYGYRNRINVHAQNSRIGFHAAESHNVVDIEHCLLAIDEVNEKLIQLRKKGMRARHESIRAHGTPGSSGFGQVNTYLLNTLQQAVSAAIHTSIEAIVEGYAGSGFFTQAMPQHVRQIAAIEMDAQAARRIEKLENPRITRVFAGHVEDHLAEASQLLGAHAQACLVDPPREGLSKSVREELLRLPFQQIIYLSCNPTTLARDLHALSTRWQLTSLTPIDLFPRTAHLECLTIFTPFG